MGRKELVICHAYEWIVKDEYDENDKVVIHAWCLDRASRPCLMRFHDFPAICNIELPRFIGEKEINWTKEKANHVYESLCGILKSDAPFKYYFQEKKKIYYYRGATKFPMMITLFDNLKSMYKCRNILQKALKIREFGYVYMKVWETNISLERKLLTLLGLNYSQWFITEAELVNEDDKISTLELEYRVLRHTLKAIPGEYTGDWLTRPSILAFDIETYSDRHNAFPQALSAKHTAFNISCIYQKAGRPETRKKVILVYGDSYDIEGVEIIKYNSELEMIDGFADIINRFDPEICIGYNIFDFDYRYLNTRLKRRLRDWKSCGRIRDEPTVLNEFGWSSSGGGHNRIAMINMDGRISIDMLPIIRREYKLDKYSLDFVSHEFLGRGKHDVSPVQMFRTYEAQKNAHLDLKNLCIDAGYDSQNLDFAQIDVNKIRQFFEDKGMTSNISLAIKGYEKACTEMTKVMAYCVEDSVLCLDIFDKINCWIGLIEMSNVVGVTLVQLFTRGQQLRTLSQLYNIAFTDDYVIDERKVVDEQTYSGGFVYPPIPGMYDFIPCLDFKSLYPTIMMAYNICYTTFIPPEYMDIIPDEKCHVIEWDEKLDDEEEDEPDDNDDEEPKINKTKAKVIHYRYKFIKEPKGLVPRLLEQLISQRDKVKGLLKSTKDITTSIVLDKRQLALKISANSMYGGLGASKGKLPLKEAAACVTAKSRESILRVNCYIENKGGCVVYGDSVTSDTPIFCRQTDTSILFMCSFKILAAELTWIEDIATGKEYVTEPFPFEVWSDKGFTQIKGMMRHRTSKKLYRITTQRGSVDVTEDHSLLNSDAQVLYPSEITLKTDLLHYPYKISLFTSQQELPEAWLYGLFLAKGKIRKTTWQIKCKNNKMLLKVKNMCQEYYKNVEFTIKKKKLIADRNNSTLICQYRQLFYKDNIKSIPDIIWNSCMKARSEFFLAYCQRKTQFKIDNKLLAADLYLLARSLGYSIKCLTGRKYKLKIDNGQDEREDRIVSIEEIGRTDEYVYDIETDNSHFGAGIGEIIVHNTDSSMPNLGLKDPKTAYRDAHNWAIELTQLFPKPMELEDEDVFYKLFCITKKKYAAIKMEKSGQPIMNPDKMKIRGVLLARRDNCKWQKKLFKHVLWNIMTSVNMIDTYNYILEQCLALICRQIPIKDLIIIKGLNSNYKIDSNAMKIFGEELIKAGQQVQAGDRLEYVIVKTTQEQQNEILKVPKTRSKVLLGYKMRLPELHSNQLASENPEPIDWRYYIEKLLQNPIQQIFSVGYMNDLNPKEEEYHKKDVNRVITEFLQTYPEYKATYLKFLMTHKNDKEKVIDEFKNSTAKKYIQPLISKYLIRRTGTSRITKQPIKMLLKYLDLRKNLLDEIRNYQP